MKEKSFAFDLHIHSKCSFDSLQNIKTIIKYAENARLDGIAITDHNTIDCALKARKLKTKLIIIAGEEIETEKGEVIGLFLNKPIKSREFKNVIREIKIQNGIVVLPHPYRSSLNESILKHIDAVETFNSRSTSQQNMKAKNLALKFKKPMVGGSDAHFPDEIGNARIIVFSKSKNLLDIKYAILRGKTKIVGRYSYNLSLSKIKSRIIRVVKTKDLKLGIKMLFKLLKKLV